MPKITKAEGPSNAADPVRAERTYAPGSVDELAERAYCAYADALGWREYTTGELMGDWEHNDDDEHEAWRAVARDLRGVFLEPFGVQPVKRRPAPAADESDNDPDVFVEPVNDAGEEYPEGGSAADVEAWVAGNSDRAAYALEREQERLTGPRAGLSASLGKLISADTA